VGQAVEYTDLGATVHPDGLPDGAAAELDGLYESLMSTADWFATRESVVPDGACLLDRPRTACWTAQPPSSTACTRAS